MSTNSIEEISVHSKSVELDEISLESGKGKKKWYEKIEITIEPALFISCFGVYLNYLVMQNLILDKACRVNLKYGDEICDELAQQNFSTPELEDAEEAVQSETAGIMQWKFIIDHAFPIFFCLVMGPWSDKHGRKPLLISPQLGYLSGAVGNILNVYFKSWSAEVCVVMYGLLHGFGGASTMLNLGTMSFMSDVSTTETKTQRLGFASMAMSLATPISSAVGGLAFEQIGFYGVFGISATCNLLAVIYFIFFVEESVKDTRSHRKTLFKDVLDLTQIYHSLRTTLKKRSGNLRTKIVLLCSLIFFATFFTGEGSIFYLYTVYVFEWDLTQYGLLNTYTFIINLIGLIFTLTVLSRYLGISDPMLGIIGSLSLFFCSFCRAFSFQLGAWMLYVGPLVDFLNGAVFIVNKSMLSQIVPASELGQLAAVICVIEAIVPPVANPVYSAVYDATFAGDFPGAAFFITAGAMIVCIVAFMYLYVDYLKTSTKEKATLQNVQTIGIKIIPT